MSLDYYISSGLSITYVINGVIIYEFIEQSREYHYDSTVQDKYGYQKGNRIKCREPEILFDNGKWSSDNIKSKYFSIIHRNYTEIMKTIDTYDKICKKFDETALVSIINDEDIMDLF